MIALKELLQSASKRGGGGGLPSSRQGIRDAKPETQEELGGEGGSWTE